MRWTLYESEEQGLRTTLPVGTAQIVDLAAERRTDFFIFFTPSSPLLLMCAMFVSATHSVSMASCHSGAEGVQVGQSAQSVICVDDADDSDVKN